MWFLDVKKINKTGGGSVGDAKFFCASDQDRQDQKEVKEGKKEEQEEVLPVLTFLNNVKALDLNLI